MNNNRIAEICPSAVTRLGRGRSLLLGVLVAFAGLGPAMADDTELFVGQAATIADPNILFIIDTSGSMSSTLLTQGPFDSATSYTGACSASRVYWRDNTGDPPPCSTLHCPAVASRPN